MHGRPYYQDEYGILYNADSLEVSSILSKQSVNAIVTSPPYWGQRDYNNDEQLGQEPTFKEFIRNLKYYFDAYHDILRDDGSLWVNLGDTYYSTSKGTGGKSDKQDSNRGSRFGVRKFTAKELPSKSLCQIPNRFSIEMQDGGWVLRNTIIWYKPNQMPTSAKDRFTHDYEHFFWYVKKPVGYYFEQQLEESVWAEKDKRTITGRTMSEKTSKGIFAVKGSGTYRKDGKRNHRAVWAINTESEQGSKHFAKFPKKLIEIPIKATCPEGGVILDPFFGAGTTAIVAEKFGRRWIGIELNKQYCDEALERIISSR